MKTSYSAILLVLLVAAATKDTLAITRPTTSTALTVQSSQRSSQGLSVDEEGNLYSTYSPSQVLRSQPFLSTATATTTTTHRRTIPASSSSSSASKTRRRKTSSSATACALRRSRGGYTNKNFIGDLCVDNEGNLYSSSSSSSIKVAALSKLRGGSLCVDNEGNLYSSSPTTATTSTSSITSSRRSLLPSAFPTSKDSPNPSLTATAASSTISQPGFLLRGGGGQNNQIGDLCVDEEGNLFSSSAASTLSATLSSLRGGNLCVDNEGNFYSPPAPTAHASLQAEASSKLIASSGTDHLYQKILLVRHHSHNQKNREDEKDKNKKEKTTQRRAFVSNSRRQTHQAQAPAHRRGDSKQQQGRSSQSRSNKRDRRRNSRFEDEDAPHALMET
ncbi:hypothetical protein FRACYDRAFT_271577 [Fragilariopsis cylindrus CCMP1102]|uniref:Uncharacterized protein n=1 Tax=Fragilariopsis cylindrus CCMP1102 TaxID=635003 RepID=A0A1E7ETL4_9STRA|nr:hypothetical protein FRACYDRAFT_271577 [Fragilariopsis cylindrus CCMP1102]|eukprot:OEU09186.1 hypothetical protein FRACYDRAFT_271577 [Fragilariopsis cylindrus CCMP1102]